jgi:hypothetical protein
MNWWSSSLLFLFKFNVWHLSLLDVLKEIDSMADQYMSTVKNLTPTKRTDQLKSIQKLFNKSREYGDDKVQLALQTYEMVCPIISSNFYSFN